MNRPKDEWLTVGEILADLGIPRRTWQRWRELGRTPTRSDCPMESCASAAQSTRHG